MNAHSTPTATPADPVPVPVVIERVLRDPDGKALAVVIIRIGPIRLDGCPPVRIEGRRARLHLPSTRRGGVTWCYTTTRTAMTLAALAAATADGLGAEDHRAHNENLFDRTGQLITTDAHGAEHAAA